MGNKLSDRRTQYRAATLAFFFVTALPCFLYSRLSSTHAVARADTSPQQRHSQTGTQRHTSRSAAKTARVDYTNFSHRTKEHQRACDACHKFPTPNWKEVRKGDAAFPDIADYPQHASCLECHYQQFFARERPAPRICSVCHIQITPRYTARYPFPSLGEAFENSSRGQNFVSDFRVNFPHDKHVDIVSQDQPYLKTDLRAHLVNISFRRQKDSREQEGADKSCAVCHQTYQPQGKSDEEFVTQPPKGLPEDAFWLKKGTFKSIPNNHATCFSCHSQETGINPLPSDCNACHKLALPEQISTSRTDSDPKLLASMGIKDAKVLNTWRRRESSATFRHEGGAHPDISCTLCHQVAAMNTLDEKTRRVSVQSCGGEGCHITATADDGGILNYEIDKKRENQAFQCSKCHILFGKESIPSSHTNAVASAAKTK